MLAYPEIDPVIFTLGPLSVRWYGLMYLLGFFLSYLLLRYQIREKSLKINATMVESLYTSLILGLMLGGRLGYVIFYNPEYYWSSPDKIFAFWDGGMSFHGALIGTLVTWLCIRRRYPVDSWTMADLVIVTVPPGLGLGRIGNFINGELYGRVTDVPWAMVFPQGGAFPRHPSQLYQAGLEGILLFAILWRLRNKDLPKGSLLGWFLILYGFFRILAEFFREPDAQLGLIAGALSMGQLLSGLMIAGGIVLVQHRSRRETKGQK